MYRKAHSRLLVLVIAATFVVGGCDLFEDDPVAPPPATPTATPEDGAAAKGTAPIPAAPASLEETKRKEYPQGRRDPFVFTPPPPATADSQEDRELGPLEHFKLDALRLVAILTGTSVPKAMFVDSTGFGHVAKEGDRIGTNGGRITAIRGNEVEITVTQAPASASDVEPDQADPERLPDDTESAPIIIRLSDTELELDNGSASNESLLEDLELDNKKAGNGSRVQ